MTMSPSLRKFTLAVHITLSVGWIGAVAAYIALDVAAATGQDAQTLRAAYLAMDLIARYAIVPLAVAALLTGIIISVGTKWGLFRHYWVVVKLLLTVFATIILLLETRTISHMADVAASGADPRELPGSLFHSGGGLLVLIVAATLAVYKPRGMTRYGWRRQHEERARPAEA